MILEIILLSIILEVITILSRIKFGSIKKRYTKQNLRFRIHHGYIGIVLTVLGIISSVSLITIIGLGLFISDLFINMVKFPNLDRVYGIAENLGFNVQKDGENLPRVLFDNEGWLLSARLCPPETYLVTTILRESGDYFCFKDIPEWPEELEDLKQEVLKATTNAPGERADYSVAYVPRHKLERVLFFLLSYTSLNMRSAS